ncbi:MAG: hypothetical protein LBT83_03705 [Tannerella sp.]|nr:hypothetical protein [Tannerella sp.]
MTETKVWWEKQANNTMFIVFLQLDQTHGMVQIRPVILCRWPFTPITRMTSKKFSEGSKKTF